MLQRIQSLYLIAFFLITLLTFFLFPELEVQASKTIQQLLNYVPLLLVGLTIFSIFMFSKRNVQFRINIFILIVSIVLELSIATNFFKSIDVLNTTVLLRFGCALVSWCGLLLANKYIRKDEALVRSIDRLR